MALACSGHTLFIGEGNNVGPGTGCQLLSMNILPGSKDYGKVVSFKIPDIQTSAHGVSGMTLGPDGKTLVVSTPVLPDFYSIPTFNSKKRGGVLVFDLSTYDFKTGKFSAPPISVDLPVDGRSGKTPKTITATKDPNRFLVCNISDYNKGLSTLVITRNGEGTITGARMNEIRMFQEDSDIIIDRLNIQRAQSAVLVTYEGVEYAIVSDDNEHSLDPYWKAMYEAPMFIPTPIGIPLPVGGSASARKVNVGGKLGIVRDPFGDAVYLGATLPLDGYGIVNLSLSEDGKVLLGQLAGWYSGNLSSPNALLQLPSESHVWNVAELIKAAVTQPEKDRLRKHLKLAPNAEQLVKEDTGWVVGTYFDPEFVSVTAVGNMGDVIGVNLRELAARQLLIGEGTPNPTEAAIKTRMDKLIDFSLTPDALDYLSCKDLEDQQHQMKLILGKDNQPLSRTTAEATCITEDNFKHSGVLFFAPVIKDSTNGAADDEAKKLRLGNVLADKSISFFFHYIDTANPDTENPIQDGKGFASVTAKDYASAPEVFFGDRPLDNPGYSTFVLKGEVRSFSAFNDTNDILDAYRVEQRLRYLGFPAMGTGNPSAGNNTIQEFKVDGMFTYKEAAALKLFEKVVRYGSSSITTTATATKAASSPYAIATAIVSSEYNVANGTYEDTITSSAAPTDTPMVLVLDQIFEQEFVRAYAESLAIAAAHQQAKANATAQIKAQAAAELKASERFDKPSIGADGMIEAGVTNVQGKLTTGWLNAYNAPHWMQLFEDTGNITGAKYKATNDKLPGWSNSQRGTFNATAGRVQNVEIFGTSWMYDLMAAKQFAPTSLKQTTSLFNGSVDANYGVSPKWQPKGLHATHDLGMAFDLGVSNYIGPAKQNEANDPDSAQNAAAILALPVGWSVATANEYAGYLVNSDAPLNEQQNALRDFLSLYALTQADGMTAELNESAVNTTAANLFGGMITGVHIGGESYPKKVNGELQVDAAGNPIMVNQNPYPSINAILKKLGISSSTEPDHQHHFHIYLKPPTLQTITANLLAGDSSASATDSTQPANLQSETQGLLNYTQTLIEGEELMFIMDVPSIPAQDTPIVLAQAATPSAGATPQPDFILKACQETESAGDPMSAMRGVDPVGWLRAYIGNRDNRIIDSATTASIKTILLESTTHGALNQRTAKSGAVYYMYDPIPNYIGNDRAVFLAEFEGKVYKIVVDIKVLEVVDESASQCEPPQLIKVTKPKPSSGATGPGAGYNLSSVAVTFADLTNQCESMGSDSIDFP